MYSKFDDLLLKCLEGTATSHEEELVLNKLKENPALWEQTKQQIEINASLKTLENSEKFADIPSKAIDRITCYDKQDTLAARSRKHIEEDRKRQESGSTTVFTKYLNPVINTYGLIAASLVIILSVIFIINRMATQPAYMRITSAEGSATVTFNNGNTLPVKKGDGIYEGYTIETAQGSRIIADFTDDNTRISIKQNSSIRLIKGQNTKELELTDGSLHAQVPKQKPGYSLSISTPQASATVIGTEFTLTADRDHTRLEVNRGIVSFEKPNSKEKIMVHSGYYAVAAPGNPLKSWMVSPPQPDTHKYSPPTEKDFVQGVHMIGKDKMPYRLFVPKGYDADYRYPLVIYLHGSGERGNDNLKQIAGDANGSFAFISPQRQKSDPCFYAAPQYWYNNDHWSDKTNIQHVKGIVEDITKKYSIDPDRIYITGISLGGFGVWEQIQNYPHLYAAGLPICGAPAVLADSKDARKFRDIPVWAWHGAKDRRVKPTTSRAKIREQRMAGGTPLYSEIPGMEHSIWNMVYENPKVIDWLFAQKRGKKTSLTPKLEITSLKQPLNTVTDKTSMHISGSINGINPETVTMHYEVNGEKSGKIEPGKKWTIPELKLVKGENTVVVIASTKDGQNFSTTALINVK